MWSRLVGFFLRLTSKEWARFKAKTLLLGRMGRCYLNGKGAVQWPFLSFSKDMSMISRNFLSSADRPNLSSFLVLTNMLLFVLKCSLDSSLWISLTLSMFSHGCRIVGLLSLDRYVLDTWIVLEWKCPRHTSPIITHPKASSCANGVCLGPIAWLFTWWTSGKSLPTRRLISADWSNSGIWHAIWCRCWWYLTISGVGISALSLGMLSHSMTGGRSNVSPPLQGWIQRLLALLANNLTFPEQEDRVYSDISSATSSASRRADVPSVLLLWSSYMAYTFTALLGCPLGKTLTSTVFAHERTLKLWPHSWVHLETRSLVDSPPCSFPCVAWDDSLNDALFTWLPWLLSTIWSAVEWRWLPQSPQQTSAWQSPALWVEVRQHLKQMWLSRINFFLSLNGFFKNSLHLFSEWLEWWMGHLSSFPCSGSHSTFVFRVYTVGCLRVLARGLLGLYEVELSTEYVRPGSFNIKLMSLTKSQNSLKGGNPTSCALLYLVALSHHFPCRWVGNLCIMGMMPADES